MAVSAVLDRVVDNKHAVLLVGEEEQEQTVPIEQLPANCPPGSWLRKTAASDDQPARWELDPEATEAAQKRISGKLDQLRQRGSKLTK
jgi:hypothetical protein